MARVMIPAYQQAMQGDYTLVKCKKSLAIHMMSNHKT